jgi:hypothetical protein
LIVSDKPERISVETSQITILCYIVAAWWQI